MGQTPLGPLSVLSRRAIVMNFLEVRLNADTHGNLADATFWNRKWHSTRLRRFTRLNYFDYRFHLEFNAIVKSGDRVLEIGCGGSRWMDYVEHELRAEVWGIDYASEGLEQTAADLSPRARDRLVYADFLSEDSLPRETFDVIYSLGFLEHFTDPARVTRRMAQLLKPGSRVLTVIPNFTGPYGWLQKTFGRDVYDRHVIMDCGALDRAHVEAGLIPVKPAGYFSCFGPLAVSYSSIRDRWKLLSSAVLLFTKLLQQAVNWLHWALHLRFETRALSPSILGFYRSRRRGEGTVQ